MAKLMPYDDAAGNHYDTSYWQMVRCGVDRVTRVGVCSFYGYRTAADRQAGRQPVGSKSYTIKGTDFDQLMAEHLAPGGPNIMQLAYRVATMTRDVVDPADPTRNVSFFEGAEDLL